MSNYLKALSFIIFLSATSCTSAQIVNHPGGSNSQYAPTNEKQRPGLVKYLNDGASSIVQSRREDAYKKMSSLCNGSYKILTEGPNAEGGVIAPIGNSYMFAQSQYWYITFECEGD